MTSNGRHASGESANGQHASDQQSDLSAPADRGGMAKFWHDTVLPGRMTASLEEPVVVFLIGMRVNSPWAVRSWWWVTRSMPNMLEQLANHPDLGLLHVEQFTRGRTSLSVQYWRSLDDLMAFASDRDQPHLAAWRRLNRQMRERDDIGFWHETYVIEPGDYEGIYVNMPRFGMAAATEVVPVGAGTERARQRLGGRVGAGTT